MISKRVSKFIKSLKIKKFRAREKSFIVEGKKNVIELLQSDFTLKHLLCTSQFISENQELLKKVSDPLLEVSSSELEDLGTFKSNNECLAVAEIKNYTIDDLNDSDHIFVLDGVNDPGNLGTIIRTLDWFGYDQMVCSPVTAELYNPKVINSTKGSFARVKVIYHDLEDLFKTKPLAAYGADLEGKSIHHWKPETPSYIIMGSESHGLSDLMKKLLKGHISIPRYGKAESLNVAIATGIICNHLRS